MHQRNRCAAAAAAAAAATAAAALTLATAARYRTAQPDFAALARTRPALQQHLVEGGAAARPTLNWKDPAACIELTKVRLLAAGCAGCALL